MSLDTTATTRASAAEPPGEGTSVSPTVRSTVRRARGPLLVAAALLLIAVVAAVGAHPGVGVLDTRSATKSGSKAVAELLRDRGVDVTQVRTLDAAASTPGGTLVVAGPDLLTQDAARRVAASGATTVVLVAPTDTAVVDAFARGTQVVHPVDHAPRDPDCANRAAVLAGRADVGGATYRAGSPALVGDGAATATGCYPVGGDPSLLVLDGRDRDVVLLGSAKPLRNDALAHQGNAALMLNLLGANDTVTWYLPSLDDLYGSAAQGRPKSFVDLVPRGVVWGLGWLAVVVVLLALWRARRLGAVVVEPLPVVVRASETVEGRARLYRRSQDRGRAGELLRAASRDRLVPRLGLPPGTGPDGVVASVASRTGRPATDVAALLYGAAPPDDAHLVRLADDLDRLEKEVQVS